MCLTDFGSSLEVRVKIEGVLKGYLGANGAATGTRYRIAVLEHGANVSNCSDEYHEEGCGISLGASSRR